MFIKNEIKNIIYNSCLKNNFLPNVLKYHVFYKKSKITKWGILPQQSNRCFVTGRAWYINKFTRQSRFVFRKESYNGNIPGFKRASW